ncbi:MAG: phosphatase PAP2 family protein [Clostridia bacterium]|nr:phosphatase PAP2 family protein [Clostridia bacterium]
MSACVTVFTVFMVTARLLSGVHWLSAIVGGVLLGGSPVTLYAAVQRE